MDAIYQHPSNPKTYLLMSLLSPSQSSKEKTALLTVDLITVCTMSSDVPNLCEFDSEGQNQVVSTRMPFSLRLIWTRDLLCALSTGSFPTISSGYLAIEEVKDFESV